jgi:predicted RecA/RadA family phage recombinase
VQPEDMAKIELVSQKIKQGSLEQFGKEEGVAIGSRMAENLGLALGDNLTLISPDGDITPMGVTPRVKAYPVLGGLAVLGLVVSALFMLRVVQKTFYGEKNERHAAAPDMTLAMTVPRALLAGTILLFGLLPRLALDLINTGVTPLVGMFK